MNDGYPLYLDSARPSTGVAPVTAGLMAAFGAAGAGVVLASRVPGWAVYAASGLAVVLMLSGWARRNRPAAAVAAPRFAHLAGWLYIAAVSCAVFAGSVHAERTRQAANFAVSERIFQGSLPPFDAVGAVANPADQWLTDRDLPRIRIVHLTGVVVEAPPPPAARQQLQNRPRVYLVRAETIAGIGGPAEAIPALVRLAVQTDPRLPSTPVADASAFSAAPGAVLAPDPLYPLPGQRIDAVLRLTEIRPGEVAPGQFDAPLEWVLAGIHAHATIDPRQWRRLPDDAHPLFGSGPLLAARRAQIYFATQINRQMQGREADTLRALCWGDTSDLTSEDRRSFQQTGTVHLLAISGLHIYVVLYLLMVLTRPFMRARLWRYALLAALLWTYAAVTGFQEPVLRAVLMFTLWIGARVFTRRFDPLNAWAVSGMVLLFFSPQSAHTVGFQLSYLTVGMLIWWAPALGDWLYARARRRLGRFLLPTLLENLCRSLAAGAVALIATLPLTIYYFGVAPSWAIVANLVMIPLFEGLLILGLPLTLWFCVSDPGWPAAAMQAATGYALNAADGLGALCGAPTDAQPPTPPALIGAAALFALAGLYFRRSTGRTAGSRWFTGGDGGASHLGPGAVRRHFAYPSFALICGMGCSILIALSGASAATAEPEVLVLGQSHPCVVVRPAPETGAAPGPRAWEAFAPVPPDSPGSVEAALRQPIARWHPLQAPDRRDQPMLLTPGVVLCCDSPAARENLLILLEARAAAATTATTPDATSAPPSPVLLLLYLTPDSDRAPRLPPAFAATLQRHLAAVLLLDSPWRLIEPDGQAWIDWGRQAHRPVLGADAAPLWRIAPNGRTLRLWQNGVERVWTMAP